MNTQKKTLVGLFILAIVFAAGCGSGSKSLPPPPPQSSGSAGLSVFLKDAPADTALSFKITITSITATKSSGDVVTLSNLPQTYELKHLALAPTPIAIPNVPAGFYKNIVLSMSNPQMQIMDSNGNVATLTPAPTLAQSSVAVPITLSLGDKSNTGVVLDFDLAKSLTLNNTSQYVLTPTVTAAVAGPNDPTPQLTNNVGRVVSVASDKSGFDLQLAESGLTVHVTIDSNTLFDPSVQSSANISIGQVLEVNALLQTNGSFLAKAINGGASSLTQRYQGIATSTYTNGSGQTVLSIAKQN